MKRMENNLSFGGIRKCTRFFTTFAGIFLELSTEKSYEGH